jgi:hypothetical protein
MQHATFLRQLASWAVKMIYGTFQCKLWHFLAQTMAVCEFCQKKMQIAVKIIDIIFCHVKKCSYLCKAKVEEVEKQQVVR